MRHGMLRLQQQVHMLCGTAAIAGRYCRQAARLSLYAPQALLSTLDCLLPLFHQCFTAAGVHAPAKPSIVFWHLTVSVWIRLLP